MKELIIKEQKKNKLSKEHESLAQEDDVISVAGVRMPITNEEDVELLESMVKINDAVRYEYTSFLRSIMGKSLDIVSVFGNIFADSAMYGFNFSGICNRGPKRKPMQSYFIFTDCMLDAWEEYGVDESWLQDSLTLVIKKINHRKRNRKYFKKRRESKLSERRASKDSKPNLVIS
ncbi:uncharacterized protein LOC128720974 [Anopheles nili]|uniref:uncharacterized protein LOC128720974 n=1 Tax=Anopheles nili TaxID=185578 RepID=UPI00237B3270|nr:uncharacterized protein LOC128720974 [Anopheles nili]